MSQKKRKRRRKRVKSVDRIDKSSEEIIILSEQLCSLVFEEAVKQLSIFLMTK